MPTRCWVNYIRPNKNWYPLTHCKANSNPSDLHTLHQETLNKFWIITFSLCIPINTFYYLYNEYLNSLNFPSVWYRDKIIMMPLHFKTKQWLCMYKTRLFNNLAYNYIYNHTTIIVFSLWQCNIHVCTLHVIGVCCRTLHTCVQWTHNIFSMSVQFLLVLLLAEEADIL